MELELVFFNLKRSCSHSVVRYSGILPNRIIIEGGINFYRCLRTELLRCSSDVEYLCKLHCIRIAFQWLMRDEAKRTWIGSTGRQILTDLLFYANKVLISL